MSRTLSTLCLLLVATASAVADPAAEQLFRVGSQVLKQGLVYEACDKFQQSRDVEVKVGTLLNLADCRERQGKLATAWELFLETKALAARQKDTVVATEAARRASAIESKRAFLTITVPADRRVPGMIVTRNGAEVPAATWDQALPIDPGSYLIEAKAPAYQVATVKVEVGPTTRVVASVPPLVATQVIMTLPARGPEPTGPRRGDVVERPTTPAPSTIDPPIRNGALGVALGGTSDGDLTPGLRALAQVEAGPGALRAVFTFLYNRRYNDTSYSDDNSNLLAFGIGGDYLLAWKRGFASALGLGVGLDVFAGGGYGTFTGTWKAVRVSPLIVRSWKRDLEVGLHTVIIVKESPILIATVGVDWFIW